jgi:hypothetical protein
MESYRQDHSQQHTFSFSRVHQLHFTSLLNSFVLQLPVRPFLEQCLFLRSKGGLLNTQHLGSTKVVPPPPAGTLEQPEGLPPDGQLTVRVTFALWLVPQANAVMVSVEVPAGVELDVAINSVFWPQGPPAPALVCVVVPAGSPVTESDIAPEKAQLEFPAGVTV